MTVTIVMHGTLRRFLPDGAARATIDLADGATVEDALAGLGAQKDTWLVARNQAVTERDTVLEPGDVIDCFEPVAGGSSRRGLSPLRASPQPQIAPAKPALERGTCSSRQAACPGKEEVRVPIRYVITTLKPGIKPEDYERWLREYDYVVAKTLPSIVSYRTHRIEGPINGAPSAGWNYIERIEIGDVEQYQRDIASPAGQELMRQLYDNYLDRPKNIFFWSEEIPD